MSRPLLPFRCRSVKVVDFFSPPSLALSWTPNLSTKCILDLTLAGSVRTIHRLIYLFLTVSLVSTHWLSAASSSPVVTVQKSPVVT